MAVGNSGEPQEQLYSMAELEEAVEVERENNAIGRKRIDRLEIEHIFKGKLKKKKAKKGTKNPIDLLSKITKGLIPEENLIIIQEHLENDSLFGVEETISKGLISKKQAGELWANKMGIAYLNPIQSVITDAALEMVPEEIARKAQVLPLYFLNNVLTISTSTPTDTSMLKRIQFICGHEVSPIFGFPSEIKDAIDIHYSSEEDVNAVIKQFQKENRGLLTNLEDLELEQLAESESVGKILDAIIHFAIKEGSSDIHLEPMETASRVRFRVDGRLREILTISKSVQSAIVSRIKILCRLNIAERRFPQDGRFEIPLGMKKAEFRVSVIPSIYGGKVVIRILGSTGRTGIISLDDMLISQSILRPWRRLVKNPNGIIFVTGPTGSGKTTTLYATLQEINRPEINITTIEDPIEISLPGLTQTQVHHKIDLGFPLILRSLLRQDPDVILVGEIRDLETGKIATEAALTGHLVFSTLHTNNAIQAVVRLLEIGIASYMVAPSINAVLAQRLAGRLDEKNKEAYRPPDEILSSFFHDHENRDALFYRPTANVAGSPKAYNGRIALHELVVVSDEIRSLITAGASMAEMLVSARKTGFKPLRYDGIKKAMLGLTTIEEIERLTPQEWVG